ncbi:MAG: hypothetical protein M3Y50_08560 [Acidobacteriota bacterium]|nr:hypothetical protein [Acidobacteriota bacterium]
MWHYVISHFTRFLDELELSSQDRMDAIGKAGRIARKLFSVWYPSVDFDPGCYAIVGSYGKGTAAKPRTDVDMIFVLPDAEFSRFNALAGQKQSALLQELKYDLLDRFPTTDVRGDGPVVKVPFDSYEFEVCPVFRLTGWFISQRAYERRRPLGTYESGGGDQLAQRCRSTHLSESHTAREDAESVEAGMQC